MDNMLKLSACVGMFACVSVFRCQSCTEQATQLNALTSPLLRSRQAGKMEEREE